MNNVFLSLGTNIGFKRDNLIMAIAMLEDLECTNVKLKSSIYETSPLLNESLDCFFNQVILIETKFGPFQLLEETKCIEKLMGRENKGDNMPRIIDIDILSFKDEAIFSDDLILPHPQILHRKFVLKPWAEIAPDYVIEGQTLSIKELYETYLGNRFKNQTVNIIDS